MNRDAIARIVSEACVRWGSAAVSTKTILDDAVDAIAALPVGGGVEEALAELVKASNDYRLAIDAADGTGLDAYGRLAVAEERGRQAPRADDEGRLARRPRPAFC